jgi:hypothetical protein
VPCSLANDSKNIKINDMIPDNLTKQAKERFINLTDSEITIEIIEEQMIAHNLPFSEFYRKYQAKHLLKYGKELNINN